MTIEDVFVEVRKELLESRNWVYVSSEVPVSFDDDKHVTLLLTLCDELQKLGYRLSDYCLTHMTDDDLVFFHKELLPYLYKKSNFIFNPLYPGFPQQVMEADKEKLWKDQHKLYKTLNYGEFQAEHPWFSVQQLEGPKRLVELEETSYSKLFELFTDLLKAPGFPTEKDINLLTLMLVAFPDFEIPENIPNKTLWAIVLQTREDIKAKDINDILRLMALWADKRVEGKRLIQLHHTKTVYERGVMMPKRSVRLHMTERISDVLKKKGLENCVLDANKYYPLWVMFGKKYHFGDYRKKYPEVTEFIHTLFTPEEQKKLTSWNSKLHKIYHTLDASNFSRLIDFIAKRPGEYMRRFDSLIRKAIELKLDPIDSVIDKIMDLDVNTKLLLEVLNYYDKRKSGAPRLVYDESGNLMRSLPELQPLPEELTMYANVMICTKIYNNIREGNRDGNCFEGEKVYLNPNLKNVPVPYNMKGSGNLVVRGTRIPIPKDTKALRLFVKWIDKDGREDLDLHSTFIDEHNNCRLIGWDSSYLEEYGVFSGDVRKRKGNCAEYIDINLETARQKFKYIVANVHNYERRPLNSLEAWIGYEFLDGYSKRLSNTYYPGDVDFEESLEVNYKAMAAFMVDFEKMEVVILNTDLTAIPSSSTDKAVEIIKFFQADPTFTVYNIANAWYLARGAEIVDNAEEATKIIDVDSLKDYTTIQSMLTL